MKDSIEKNAKATDKFLRSRLSGSPKSLYNAASHLIVHGGKRLRPYMVVKSCQVLGGSAARAMPAAAAVEMVHNFTLVHDDIMDNDNMRHGVQTVHKKFGIDAAILAGDVLFSKAFSTISASRLPAESVSKLISRLADACVDVCEGQQADVDMGRNPKFSSHAQYVGMICKKTAALFEASCAMGAICATSRPADVARLASFGRNLGIAFQITDDLIGAVGNPKITKKPVGNDIREGKKSLPILLAIRAARGKDKRDIMRSFGNPKATKYDVGKAVDVVRAMEIKDDVRRHARRYAKKAASSLNSYNNPAKRDLAALLDFVVEREV
ncbi:MAG: polyprenyl synthetase family protein [Nitrosopumilus sp. H8]|nr:MAG: polyprenyl synthetase family protein [Nitrosopumilus sp. H13]RNJ78669.1 MAG: polyprenyl synthetase family protein [Nitrosopumilus sp. H8]